MDVFQRIQRTFHLGTYTGSRKLVICIRQTTLLGLVLLLLCPPRVEAYGVCRISFRCANGGEEKYGQSIFGPCRCICPRPFTGPRCQYREFIPAKRSSFGRLADFLRSSLAEEQQQQQQQQQQEDEMLIPGEDVVTEYTDEEQPIVRQRRSKRLHPRFFFRR